MAKEKDKKVSSESDEPKKNDSGIIPIDITSEMKESYLDYAMSVIVMRALPDVRDGLKPVHRRILYAMYREGLLPSKKFSKSAGVVGEVLKKYHPHGDSSVYEALVKMTQEFTSRYPLSLGQGNFGSIDGDSAAAYRYTEAKMSKLGTEMMKDIDRDTVAWRPNYDNTVKEPVYLPSAIPTLLLNGTLGIAVGMATNIPPHNLCELIDATTHLIGDKNSTTEDLLKYVKGPDFPLGGIIYGKKDIEHAYASGRGGVVCRGETEIVEGKAGIFQIIITSIPFRVNKADMMVKIANLVRDKKLEGIKDVRDESSKDIRVVVDLKSGINPQKVLNFIYKHTELETTFNFNMVALQDGVPQLMSLKGILESFIAHRQLVVTKRTEFNLKKAQDRAHILEGLKKALDHIDEVIKTIRASKDTLMAHANLMKKFKFTDVQATAILEMRLQKLAGLERENIENELKEKKDLIKELKAILADPKRILKIIKEELEEIKEKYGDDRRTKVVRSKPSEISDEDLIEEKESMLVLTHSGYIKRTDPTEYKVQKRGGIGVIDLSTKDEDFVTSFLTTSTHSSLLFFTDAGKAYQSKMYEIPEGRRATKGKSIMNFLSMSASDKVTSVLAMPKESDGLEDSSLFMITKQGVAKKVKANSFKDVRRSGLIAIKLADGDELLWAGIAGKGDGIVLATALGQSIRFKESDVREMGRGAGGVRAIKLGVGDEIVGASVLKAGAKGRRLLVMSENGYGKKTEMKEYKVQNRGGSGIKTMKVTEKTGKLIASKVVTDGEENEIVAVSKRGQVIRTSLESIPTIGRQTQGVRVMKMKTGDKIASLVCL